MHTGPQSPRFAEPSRGHCPRSTWPKVITVFWNFLVLIKDFILHVGDVFTTESLPSAPAVPVGAS